MSFITTFRARWADMDPNAHMRHSAYNDYAAQARVEIFATHDFPLNKLLKMGVGPVLFREETRFFREISLGEDITVSTAIKAMREDGSKWTIQHDMMKADGSLAATLVVDGAWIDLKKRKVVVPPQELQLTFQKFPRREDFELIPPKVK